MNLDTRLRLLDDELRALSGVLVAFSGGADSAFLLAAAVRSLGSDRVLAVTSTSASLASGEIDAATRFAEGLGVEHLQLVTAELDRPEYAANGPDRCYHCKSELLDRLCAIAGRRHLPAVATGTNADDRSASHRPGLRAADERGVVTPLANAGFRKADVREASRRWNLPTWDKPQAACLASRIAYGVRVDEERLRRVDRAEADARTELAAAGIPVVNLRVRDLGDRARLEVDAAEVARVAAEPRVLAAVVAAGFSLAEVDPRGFRTGSLNEQLLPTQRIGGGLRSSWDLPIVD